MTCGCPAGFFAVVLPMARSRRVQDALRLARNLLKSAAGPQLAQWLLIVVRARAGSLQESELEYLRQGTHWNNKSSRR